MNLTSFSINYLSLSNPDNVLIMNFCDEFGSFCWLTLIIFGPAERRETAEFQICVLDFLTPNLLVNLNLWPVCACSVRYWVSFSSFHMPQYKTYLKCIPTPSTYIVKIHGTSVTRTICTPVRGSLGLYISHFNNATHALTLTSEQIGHEFNPYPISANIRMITMMHHELVRKNKVGLIHNNLQSILLEIQRH